MFDTEMPREETPFDLLPPSKPVTTEEPSRFETMVKSITPGSELAAFLATVDRKSLSGHDRVILVQARSRLRSWIDAEILADIDSVSQSAADWVAEEIPDGDLQDIFYTTAGEIEAALTLTRRAAEFQTELADRLYRRLPGAWHALHQGRIDLARARVLADQTSHIPQELAQRVCDTALEQASRQTTGQLRARIQRLIINIDPAAARDRYEQRLSERKVVCEPTDAGTADLHGLDLPSDQANAAMRRINRLAHASKRGGDRRCIDQIRADIFLDLLTGRGHQGRISDADRAQVDIRAPLTTLLGLADDPGEIPGWGPVIADIVRKVVANQHDANWQAGITHNDEILDLVTTKRRPTKTQKRAVQAIAPDCVWPTCRMPFADCDLNHVIPWAEAHHTVGRELEPLCRHHHVNHHRRGWKLKRRSNDTYTWTSPLGHTPTKSDPTHPERAPAGS